MEGGEDGSASAWRFGSDSSRVPIHPSSDLSWAITADLTTGFKRVAETCSNIITKCKRQCQNAKLEGSCHALESILLWIMSQDTEHVFHDELSDHAHTLLTREERPVSQEIPPEPASFPAHMPGVAAGAQEGGERGWEKVDSMFTETDFRIGCYMFTQFYKQRTREIRLAYVCGFRDALADILSWASSHAMDAPQRPISRHALHDICSAQLLKLSPDAAHAFSASLHASASAPSQHTSAAAAAAATASTATATSSTATTAVAGGAEVAVARSVSSAAGGEEEEELERGLTHHGQEHHGYHPRHDMRSDTESVGRPESELDFADEHGPLALAHHSPIPSPLSFVPHHLMQQQHIQHQQHQHQHFVFLHHQQQQQLQQQHHHHHHHHQQQQQQQQQPHGTYGASLPLQPSPSGQLALLGSPRRGILNPAAAAVAGSPSGARGAPGSVGVFGRVDGGVADEEPAHWVVGGKRESRMDVGADPMLLSSPRDSKRGRFGRKPSDTDMN